MLASNGSAFGRFSSTAQLGLGLAVLFAAWTLGATSAHAQTTLAADLDLQLPVSVNGVNTGAGFGFRVGHELRLPLVSLNPEIGFTYASFSKDEPPKVYRGIAGIRLGVGELIRAGVAAHVGFGYTSWSPRYGEGTINLNHSGFTYDVGVFLEFVALPLLNIGVHGLYTRVSDDDDQPDSLALHWIQLGLHATLVL